MTIVVFFSWKLVSMIFVENFFFLNLIIFLRIDEAGGIKLFIFDDLFAMTLSDTGEDSKLVHRRKRPKVDTSMTQRRVENTRIHLVKISLVSVKPLKLSFKILKYYTIRFQREKLTDFDL